jgi:Protein of unknown function (DUF3800)
MPTFIDESGDTGPTKDGGTSYFRLAAVWVPTIGDAALFRGKIQRLRLELGLPESFEFKFAKTHRKPELRKAFFSAALSQVFRFAVSSIDKTDIYWTSAHRHEQHWACATELAAALRTVYHQAEEGRESPLKEMIIVDDNADRDFLATIKRQFRGLESKRHPGSSMIGKVLFRSSLPDAMLQLVDMVCGAVGVMIDGNDAVSYDQIAERSLNIP